MLMRKSIAVATVLLSVPVIAAATEVPNAYGPTPQETVMHIWTFPGKPAPRVLRANAASDYAVLLVSSTGPLFTPPSTLLLKHFSFGWQPIEVGVVACGLDAYGISAEEKRALLVGMPQPTPAPGEPKAFRCHSQIDVGSAADVEAIRKRMGPVVPFVIVSHDFAFSQEIYDGGGCGLFQRVGNDWKLIAGCKGALDPTVLKRVSIPRADLCAMDIAGQFGISCGPSSGATGTSYRSAAPSTFAAAPPSSMLVRPISEQDLIEDQYWPKGRAWVTTPLPTSHNVRAAPFDPRFTAQITYLLRYDQLTRTLALIGHAMIWNECQRVRYSFEPFGQQRPGVHFTYSCRQLAFGPDSDSLVAPTWSNETYEAPGDTRDSLNPANNNFLANGGVSGWFVVNSSTGGIIYQKHYNGLWYPRGPYTFQYCMGSTYAALLPSLDEPNFKSTYACRHFVMRAHPHLDAPIAHLGDTPQ